MKLFGLFILSLCIGIGCMFLYKVYFIRVPLHLITPLTKTPPFSLINAPTNSLRGSILSFSGDVSWESRIATIPAKLTEKRPLQQGESIVTKTGSIIFSFPQSVTVSAGPNTSLNIIQTLPTSMLIEQPTGTTTYTKIGTTPVTIRSLHLLIKPTPGIITIRTDDKEKMVTVDVTKGSVTLAFNDTNNITTLQEVKENQEVTFDDTTKISDIEPLATP